MSAHILLNLLNELRRRDNCLLSILSIFRNELYKVRKMAKIRNRYNQVPHLTRDTTWESDKKHNKHNKGEPRGQPIPSR